MLKKPPPKNHKNQPICKWPAERQLEVGLKHRLQPVQQNLWPNILFQLQDFLVKIVIEYSKNFEKDNYSFCAIVDNCQEHWKWYPKHSVCVVFQKLYENLPPLFSKREIERNFNILKVFKLGLEKAELETQNHICFCHTCENRDCSYYKTDYFNGVFSCSTACRMWLIISHNFKKLISQRNGDYKTLSLQHFAFVSLEKIYKSY